MNDSARTSVERIHVSQRKRAPGGRFTYEPTYKDVPCERCGEIFRQHSGKRHFCSSFCYNNVTRYIDKQGYVVIKRPGHPHATTNGWVREHIVVACETLGRPLLPNEEVHHKDENKANNAPLNLEVLLKGEHTRLHQRGRVR